MSSTANSITAEQLNVQLRIKRLRAPDLVRDYFDAAPALAPFYAGCPWDRTSLLRVAERVNARFDASRRQAMAASIRATTPAAQDKLARIANGEGFFVATGQQAGLFTGPLFTIYKALTAIRTAECFERELGVPVAPLFWVAADDHDFAEVNHTWVIGADNDLHRIEIAAPDDVQRSMHRHLLPDEIGGAIDRLAELLPAGEFAAQSVEWVRAAYVPGRSVAAAFTELLMRIFAGYDLLVTASADPVVKRLAAPIIAREIDRSQAHEDAVRRQTYRLLDAGYHEQVTVRPGAANVLYEDENGRDRLVRENGGWHLSRSKRLFQTADLHALLAEHPERFSPNVLLRPVVASEVFPTLAYVGGPAEVSYFGQIGCLFEKHDVVMPLAMPRASVDIVEHKIRKVMDKFGLEADDVRQPFDRLASQVMRDDLPDSVTGAVRTLQQQLVDAYAQLVEGTEAIDPTLKSPLENARNASQKALADVEKKIVSHLKKKNEIGLEQLRKASVNLFPNGLPQERALSVVFYLARYGPAIVDAIAAEIRPELDRTAPAWQGVVCP